MPVRAVRWWRRRVPAVARAALLVAVVAAVLAVAVARSGSPTDSAVPVASHAERAGAHDALGVPAPHFADGVLDAHGTPAGTDPTSAQLDAQVRQTRALIARFPTIAAAEAAGYRRSGAFAPGLGTHYVNEATVSLNDDGVMDHDDLMAPELIFDGTGPDAPLAGFMYLARTEGEPDGFAGHEDHWHAHTNLCVVDRDGVLSAPIGADADATAAECAGVGGVFYPKTAYMLHVWSVPGYESPLGLFSDTNPVITCPDGTGAIADLATLGFAPSACQNP